VKAPKLTERPAETTSFVAAIVAAAAALGLDLDEDTRAALIAVVGAIGAVVTWIVERRRSKASEQP